MKLHETRSFTGKSGKIVVKLFGGLAMKWIPTNHPGLRYYEHESRRHGKKRDRYYNVRFKVDKKLYSYGIGWLSDGIPEAIRKEESHLGFEDYCLKLLRQYKTNIKIGAGPQSPKEKRKLEDDKRKAEQARDEQERRESVSLTEFFETQYLPIAEADKKPRTVEREAGLFRMYIKPILGSMAMKDVSSFHMERLKKDMAAKGQSPRSIEYCLSVIRQIFNTAKRLKVFTGDNPTTDVKFPKPDNGRMRYLTNEEANLLLATLKERSQDVHDITLLSLHCGLRMGEIFNLAWADIDLTNGRLTIRDAKAGSRYAFLTGQAADMLKGRDKGKPSDYVFRSTTGGKITKISHTFFRTVEELELNKGITDPRQKVCFHTCRHSYASWLVEQGQDLYTVQRLLGHKTSVMTQRYSHIAENKFKEAARALSAAINAGQKENAGQLLAFPG
jgi:integrase